MRKKNGFTLIELLVVIAIVALLVAIIAPALRVVKETAKCLLCQTNLRSFVTAVHTYSVEHDERICGSWNYSPPYGWGDPWDWAWAPWDASTDTAVTNYLNATQEQKQEGVKQGVLYKFDYMTDIKAYHCPSDKSPGGNFRSYSMPDCLNGKWGVEVSSTGDWSNLTKYSQIKSPSDKYVFLEENDTRGYNINSWVIHTDGTDAAGWGDPLAVWHTNKSNLSFADGHAETWNWSDETSELFLLMNVNEWSFWGYVPHTPEGTEDLKRLHRGWAE